MPDPKKNEAKEVADLQKDGNEHAGIVNLINRKLNRKGATLITLERVKPYVDVPDEVEQASEKVLKDNKTGLNMNGWVRAVMMETKGVHAEAELKEFLQTLIDDEIIAATPGRGREKILTLK